MNGVRKIGKSTRETLASNLELRSKDLRVCPFVRVEMLGTLTGLCNRCSLFVGSEGHGRT